MLRSIALFVYAVATVAATSGCYESHLRQPAVAALAPDAGASDAASPGPMRDAGTSVEPSCASVVRTLDVPRGGCIAEVIADTVGNDCGARERAVASIVRVRRPLAGMPWYFLIRSRDPAATEIAAGTVGEGCTCAFHASASGGDLTRSGIGGDISDASTTELDLVLDGQDHAMWLRVCDGPPG